MKTTDKEYKKLSLAHKKHQRMLHEHRLSAESKKDAYRLGLNKKTTPPYLLR